MIYYHGVLSIYYFQMATFFSKQREIPEESRLLSLPLPQGLTEVTVVFW